MQKSLPVESWGAFINKLQEIIMKKLVLIAALGVCFAGGASAQAKPAVDSKITACKADHAKAYLVVKKDQAKATGKGLGPEGEKALRKIETALKKSATESAKDDLSLQECKDLIVEIKTFQTFLDEVLTINSETFDCFAEFKSTANEADAIVAKGQIAKKISDAEVASYKIRDAQLDVKRKMIMGRTNFSKKECDALLNEAKKEKAWATKAAGG
jgi:hypothetical protein